MIIEPQEFVLQRVLPSIADRFKEVANGDDPKEQRGFALALLVGADIAFYFGNLSEEEKLASWRQGFAIVRQLADEGNIWSMRTAAACLATGAGTEQNIAQAKKYLFEIRHRVALGNDQGMAPDVVERLEDLITHHEQAPAAPGDKPALPKYGL